MSRSHASAFQQRDFMTGIREGVLAVVFALLLTWPVQAVETIYFSTPRKVTVTAFNVNLRSGPGPDNPVVGRIKKRGVVVDAGARNGEWFRIKFDGTDVWIHGKFLRAEQLVEEPSPEKSATGSVADGTTATRAQASGDEAINQAAGDETTIDGADEADGILITSIIFEGNTVIKSAELAAAVKDYIDQPLTMEEMGELTDQITLVYQEKGYILARAYLPEQEIKEGTLKIAVAEGRIGKIKVAGKTHYHERVIKRYFGTQEKLGVVKESALEKGLVLSNEIPKVKTDIVLKKGEKSGEVDMVVNVKDSSLFTFGLDAGIDYNNFGSVYTSRNRYGATANIYDHFWGSQLKVRGVAGDSIDDSALVTGDWTVPINRYGTRLAAHYVAANYLIGEGLEFMGLGGDTEIYGFKVDHPLITQKNRRLGVSAGYQHKHVESKISGSLQVDATDTFHVGFNFDNLDRFLGKNIVFFDYRNGHLDPQKEYTWSDTNASASYAIAKLDLARVQKIYGYSSLLVRGSGQYSAEKLVFSEQIVIGGYGSVRGHQPASNIGDSGYTLSAEFMTAPPFVADKKLFGLRATQMFQLAAFYDFGQIYVNDPGPGVLDTATLAGAGVGFRIFYKDRFVFKYDFGVPINKHNGQDSVIHYFLGSLKFF